MAGVKKSKFADFEDAFKKAQSSDTERPFIDLKAIYGGLSTKQTMILKTFSANYNKLLKQMMEHAKQSSESSMFSTFFLKGKSVVMCCLPFKIYSRKLSSNMAQLIMQYSKVEPQSQLLIFNSLQHLVMYLTKQSDNTYFENAIKKMYLEFTKESRSGGGGLSV